MSLKVLIAHNYSDDSFAAMSKQLSNRLADMGCQVVFISHHPRFGREIVDENGVRVISWPEVKPSGIKSWMFYWKLHRRFNPDVVIAHFTAVNVISVVSWLMRAKRRIVYCHTLTEQIDIDDAKTIKAEFKGVRKDLVYWLATRVVIVSDYSRRDFKSIMGLRRPNLITVHNGLPDRSKGLVLVPKNEKGKIFINFLGRLDKSKGIGELVSIFYKHKAEFPSICIRIAGTGSFSDFFEQLTCDQVKFVGRLEYSKVDDYLKSGHFTVIPSVVDNLPTVGIESLMNGIPVLGNNRGGIPEIVENGQNGILFDGLTENNVLVLLRTVVAMPIDDYKKMAEKARQTYLDKFSMDVYLNNMVEKVIFPEL